MISLIFLPVILDETKIFRRLKYILFRNSIRLHLYNYSLILWTILINQNFNTYGDNYNDCLILSEITLNLK